MRQLARHSKAPGAQFGQQLAVVHGSFHEVRKELCGKAASGARHAGFRGGFQRGAGFGLESGTHSPLTTDVVDALFCPVPGPVDGPAACHRVYRDGQ